MAIRGSCGIVLLLIAGCGSPNAPSTASNAPATIPTGTNGDSAAADSDSEAADSDSAIDDSTMVDLKDLSRRIDEATFNHDFEEALKITESALEKQPNNLQFLFTAANFSQRTAKQLAVKPGVDRKVANVFFLKSAAFVRKVRKVQGDQGGVPVAFLTDIFYNEACAHATNGNKEKALASLKEALEGGFVDLALPQTDPDLDSLRDLPEFASILGKAIEIRKALTAKTVREELESHEAFDFDFNLVSIDGDKVAMADYKGKVLIVDFWGTWCPPCREEIPHFVELHRKYKDDGLAIVGINYENSDDPAELIRAFAKDEGILYPCVIGDDATRNLVPNFEGYPTTLFVDRNGKVRLKIVGLHPYERLEAIVQALLDESTSGG